MLEVSKNTAELFYQSQETEAMPKNQSRNAQRTKAEGAKNNHFQHLVDIMAALQRVPDVFACVFFPILVFV